MTINNPPVDDSIQRLPEKTRLAIIEEVKQGLAEVFGGNMLFGFVCGGIAKGYADDQHDVDTFVCLAEPVDDTTLRKYYDWYFALHKRYNLPPDYDYPGEVVTYDQLASTLKRLKGWTLTFTVEEVAQKKSIIWADMLTGGVDGISGSSPDLLAELINEYKDEPAKWKAQLLDMIPPDEVDAWREKSHTLIMERFMRYPKHDGKGLDSIYG